MVVDFRRTHFASTRHDDEGKRPRNTRQKTLPAGQPSRVAQHTLDSPPPETDWPPTSSVAVRTSEGGHCDECWQPPLQMPFAITIGGGAVYPSAIGLALIKIRVGNRIRPVEVKATLLIEESPLNIFSGEKTYRAGGYMIKNDIFNGAGKVVAQIDVSKRGFLLEVEGSAQDPSRGQAMASLTGEQMAKLWQKTISPSLACCGPAL